MYIAIIHPVLHLVIRNIAGSSPDATEDTTCREGRCTLTLSREAQCLSVGIAASRALKIAYFLGSEGDHTTLAPDYLPGAAVPATPFASIAQNQSLERLPHRLPFRLEEVTAVAISCFFWAGEKDTWSLLEEYNDPSCHSAHIRTSKWANVIVQGSSNEVTLQYVVKDSCPACHEFESSKAEDPPSRADDARYICRDSMVWGKIWKCVLGLLLSILHSAIDSLFYEHRPRSNTKTIGSKPLPRFEPRSGDEDNTRADNTLSKLPHNCNVNITPPSSTDLMLLRPTVGLRCHQDSNPRHSGHNYITKTTSLPQSPDVAEVWYGVE
ncbi:hypothetical protein TNCV_298571 [Trichonephila clavipes]|nr:hypothetical protein TNCV_298571 [Trichonephila clavipes]